MMPVHKLWTPVEDGDCEGFLNVFVDPQHHIIDHAVVQFPKKAQRS